MDSIIILLHRAPYGRENAFGAFYTAIAGIEAGLDVGVVLIDDGVYAALERQRSEELKYPSIEDLVYSIYQEAVVYAHAPSLTERGIKKADMISIVQIIEQDALAKSILSAEGLILF